MEDADETALMDRHWAKDIDIKKCGNSVWLPILLM